MSTDYKNNNIGRALSLMKVDIFIYWEKKTVFSSLWAPKTQGQLDTDPPHLPPSPPSSPLSTFSPFTNPL